VDVDVVVVVKKKKEERRERRRRPRIINTRERKEWRPAGFVLEQTKAQTGRSGRASTATGLGCPAGIGCVSHSVCGPVSNGEGASGPSCLRVL